VGVGEPGDPFGRGRGQYPVAVVDGGADPQLGTGCVSGRDLAVEHRGEVLRVAPAGVAGMIGEPAGCFGDPWRFNADARWSAA